MLDYSDGHGDIMLEPIGGGGEVILVRPHWLMVVSSG